ncbi:MAG: hypothetical protein M1824_005624 [Vezdaea acicularis]|nr:MAG: hypothetical protein M1824_005624 [Vezdaea acicularis]
MRSVVQHQRQLSRSCFVSRTRHLSRRRYASLSAANLKFGQPTHETHPHLLKAGEVTPGITALEYAERRAELAEKLPEKSIAVLTAATVKYRAGVVFHEFHQDSDFFYLTGFTEPEATAIIEKTGSGGQHVFHLFLRPKDPVAQIWEGARSGLQAALDVFNADEAEEIENLSFRLPDLVGEAREVYTDSFTQKKSSDISIFRQLFQDKTDSSDKLNKVLKTKTIKPLKPVMNSMRLFKSDAEITVMRRAGQFSGRAITNAMQSTFDTEKSLDAFLEWQFKVQGCDTSAYIPVVAGGTNALSIHYVQNNDVLSQHDLVLVDAGGQYGGYVTDITRTWPVSRKFTDSQRDLYEAVLRVQRTCVALARQDAELSLDKIHEIATTGLRDELQSLGFDLKGHDTKGDLFGLFPHHVGHFVGLDLHDTPGVSRKDNLKARQCITIEPGIYVPDDERWPKHFRGMGIRIEDSVCIQEEHPLVLTAEAVKEVVDIEELSR